MTAGSLTFVTPYWSGSRMMRIHLESIRRFHPDAPILVSKRGGGQDEMRGLERDFGLRCWLEECEFPDAYVRLLQRCDTEYVCIMDHDAVLLGSLDRYVEALASGRYDLVGVEERIRLPDSVWQNRLAGANGWLRFAPGCTAANFMLFNLRAFKAKWGLRGIFGSRPAGTLHYEFDYGIGQKLKRHHLLLPWHAPRYGMGNLLRDGDLPVAWHQWYGSYRTRLGGPSSGPAGGAGDMAPDPDERQVYRVAEEAERAFIDDYPALDFSGLTPAWGPERDIRAEQQAIEAARPPRARAAVGELVRRLHRWKSYGVRGFALRALAKFDLWWRLR